MEELVIIKSKFSTVGDIILKVIIGFSLFLSVVLFSKDNYYARFWLGLAVVFFLIWLFWSRRKIILTNKNIYLHTLFGGRTALPLDKICEHSTHRIFSFITFSTPSGRIRAYLIENYFEISEELRKLLNKQQDDE